MKEEDFVRRVQEQAGLETRGEAQQWAAGVLIALVHLLPDSESRRHLAAQLPGSLKSRLQAEPPRGLPMTRDAFLQHVGAALGCHAPGAERALGAVYSVLRDAVSPGELADIEARVPQEVRALLARLVPPS